jgi:hypothetical protein
MTFNTSRRRRGCIDAPLVMRGQKARSAVFTQDDPRIHFLRKMMDCRVRPGNDELKRRGDSNG